MRVMDELLPGFCLRKSFSADPTALHPVDNAFVIDGSNFHRLPLFIFPGPSSFLHCCGHPVKAACFVDHLLSEQEHQRWMQLQRISEIFRKTG